LFEWVREAFIELRERNDRPGGAVCLNALGRCWKDDASASQVIRQILRRNKRTNFTLKKSQQPSDRQFRCK
jgi:hypothetical protein